MGPPPPKASAEAWETAFLAPSTALPVGRGGVLGRVPSAPAEPILHPWGDVTVKQRRIQSSGSVWTV